MNETDYAIADAILESRCDGTFDIEIELGNNTFAQVCGDIRTENYQEDDFHCGYGNGTGAWITTYASVHISNLEFYSYNEKGDEEPCTLKVHESEIEDYCINQLLRN